MGHVGHQGCAWRVFRAKRQLRALLNAGAAEKALELHTSTTDALARIRTAVSGDHKEFNATVEEVTGLFRLSKSVIQLPQ